MNLTEVTETIKKSLSKRSYSDLEGASTPIVSLLGLTKKEKAEAVKQACLDYMRGQETVLLLSLSTSSKLFKYVLSHVPHIWFIEGKVTEKNKRKDVLALFLTYHELRV